MVNIKRWLVHAFTPPWCWKLAFRAELLKDIEQAIAESESRHLGELRFAIENNLAPSRVLRGLSAKQRAFEVFSNLKVWDTDENCGVLIYVSIADSEVHIVADRGIHKRVSQQQWDTVALSMQQSFSRSDYRTGALTGIQQISEFLYTYFPSPGMANPNQLPNKPVIVGQ